MPQKLTEVGVAVIGVRFAGSKEYFKNRVPLEGPCRSQSYLWVLTSRSRLSRANDVENGCHKCRRK